MHKLVGSISYTAIHFTSAVLYYAFGALKPDEKALKNKGFFYLKIVRLDAIN